MSFKITAESDLWESRGTFTLAHLFSYFEGIHCWSFTIRCGFIRKLVIDDQHQVEQAHERCNGFPCLTKKCILKVL
jgi:hypothetical protein